ncbi:MAG: hypothetical protein LBE67_10425 [Kocuria palustris]|nr:hypothetical protein [Kocuria palustris]
MFSSNGAFGKRSKSKAITVQVLDACGAKNIKVAIALLFAEQQNST